MIQKMGVPFFGLDRMYANHSDQILNRLHSVYSHSRVLQGPEVLEFEERIASLCQRKYATAVGSCTDALFFVLKTAGIQPGDEVLITSYSFLASVSSILRVGGIPIFVDINSDTFMMDIKDLERKITSKTKAILAVHLFGQCLPMENLKSLAKSNKLILLEDAAQVLGASRNNNMAGSLGLASCVSFDPTKIVGAFGNGGIILTDDENFDKHVKMMRYHGKDLTSGEFKFLGYNSRLATSQAALLNLQLDFLPDWIKKRNEIARYYNDALGSISGVQIPVLDSGNMHIYHKYVIKVERRDELAVSLSQNNIETMVHYRKAMYENKLFDNIVFRADKIINVHEVKANVLSLPIYPELKKEEIEYICQKIKSFYKNV